MVLALPMIPDVPYIGRLCDAMQPIAVRLPQVVAQDDVDAPMAQAPAHLLRRPVVVAAWWKPTRRRRQLAAAEGLVEGLGVGAPTGVDIQDDRDPFEDLVVRLLPGDHLAHGVFGAEERDDCPRLPALAVRDVDRIAAAIRRPDLHHPQAGHLASAQSR